jgi:3-dehydroquinate dehydratase II
MSMSTPSPNPDRPILLLVHGPNLNLLGSREPAIYGTATLADHVAAARQAAEDRGWALEAVQSNHEGAVVEAIHGARGRCRAVIVNPGAFTHYAYALTDALSAYEGVTVELHLSNPAAREEWRRRSVVAPVVTGTIAGFGATGYRLAVDAAITLAILAEQRAAEQRAAGAGGASR